jgi:CMP-N,N'-diacetyllegionaminic acid synthase
MKIVSLIPARGGSKGIPKKNIKVIAGHPMIHYAIEASKQCDHIVETYVSTDDLGISIVAENRGAQIVKRPIELASDTACIESVIEHFTFLIDYDIMILIQPTSPMIKSEYLNEAFEIFFRDKLDSLYAAVDCQDILIWNDKFPMNYDYMNRGRRQDRKQNYTIEAGMFYITTRNQFLNSKCRLGGKIGRYYIPFWNMFEVDDLEDFNNIEKLMR